MQLIGCSKFALGFIASFGMLAISCPGAFAQGTPERMAKSIATSSYVYSEFDLGPVTDSLATKSSSDFTGAGTAGASGTYGYHDSSAYTHSKSGPTTQQTAAYLLTRTTQLDKVFGGARALPPTRLDSFVKDAGGNADQIYGDEGDTSIPPFFTFDDSHRIERGIHSDGLTTGHKSNLPEAWGWPQ